MDLFQALEFFQHFQEGHQGLGFLTADYHQQLSILMATWVLFAHSPYRHLHGPPKGLL